MSKKQEKRKHTSKREEAIEKRAKPAQKIEHSLPKKKKKRKPLAAPPVARASQREAAEVHARPDVEEAYVAVESVSVVELEVEVEAETETPFAFPSEDPVAADVRREVDRTVHPFMSSNLDMQEEVVSTYTTEEYARESYAFELVLRNAEEEVNHAMREAEQATRLCGEFDAWQAAGPDRDAEQAILRTFEESSDFAGEASDEATYNFEHI